VFLVELSMPHLKTPFAESISTRQLQEPLEQDKRDHLADVDASIVEVLRST
jgi:hypothetical protein